MMYRSVMFRCALAAFVLVSPSQAGTFFVAPVGSDSNPGTFDRPWKTISFGVKAIAGGDTLNVRGGTYTNAATGGWKAGTATAPTIVQAYNGETVLCRPYGNTEFFYFGAASAHDIIVSGFKIDASNASLSPPGIKITEGAYSITITNCEVYNVPSSHGILIADGNLTTYSNKVVNCVIHDISIRYDGGTDDHGIYLSGSVYGNVIDGNTIYNCNKGGQTAHGIHQFSGSANSGNIYRNNTIYNCNRGIGLYSGPGAWVYNNLIYSNVVGIYLNYGVSSTRIFNNTLDRNQGGIIVENSAGSDHWIVNNLVSSTLKFGSVRLASGAGTSFLTNNLSCDNLTPNFEDDSGRAALSGNLFGNQFDAGFVNASAGDYHLLSSSSGRGAGVPLTSIFGTDKNGNSRPASGPWSIGAFEFTGGTSVNNPPIISTIGDVSIDKNTTTSAINFTVSDTETPAGNLTITGTSSLQSLVPDAAIKFGGSGNNRNVTVTPAVGATGVATITISVSDGINTSVRTFQISVVEPVAINVAPAVSAGSDQTITLPSSASLLGVVTDDGLPAPPGATTILWSKTSGPGTVTFGNTSAAATTAVFSAPGTYVLLLTATDGALTSTDQLTVTVNPQPLVNSAPTVTAGPNQTITLPASATLSGTVSDDGLPAQPGTVTMNWSTLSGPASASFANPAAAGTTATFSASGTYVLRLTANDGALSSSSDVTINVNPAPTGNGVVIPIEAETGVLIPPMTVRTDTNGTGLLTETSYVLSPNTDSGTAAYIITVPTAGDYVIWCRTLPATATNDSYYVAVDGGTEEPYITSDGTPQSAWIWTRVNRRAPTTQFSVETRVFSLVAGQHTIRFRSREANTPLDKLVVTDDPNFVPSDVVVQPINQPPTVFAGPDQSITLPANAVLSATVTDDGLPTSPGVLTRTWSKVSGPGTVNFGNAAAAPTTATFTAAGNYTLRLSVTDGALTSSDDLIVIVNPAPSNSAPQVSAGPDQNITLPSIIALTGIIVDDGMPNPPGVTTKAWSKVSGPGIITFANALSANTTATFSVAGTYVLRLTASDGALSAADELVVTVNPQLPPNTPPTVSAGADQTIVFPSSVFLAGTATDDGLPLLPGELSLNWSKVSGPGNVSFANSTTPETSAAFSAGGTYVLRLTANDGNLSASDDIVVTVEQPSPGVFANIVLEAELSSLTSPMQVASETDYSDSNLADPPAQTTYVRSTTPEAGSVLFTVNITTPGDYQIWCRVLALSSGTDSFYVSVDGGPEVPYIASDGVPVAAWKWTRVNRRIQSTSFSVAPRTFSLSTGTHTILFRSREENTFLDKIRVTNDPTFVPPGTTSPAAGPQITNLAFTDNGMILTWPTVPGRLYRVYYKPDLAAAQWLDLAGDLAATDITMSVVDLDSTGSTGRIYSVYAVP